MIDDHPPKAMKFMTVFFTFPAGVRLRNGLGCSGSLGRLRKGLLGLEMPEFLFKTALNKFLILLSFFRDAPLRYRLLYAESAFCVLGP